MVAFHSAAFGAVVSHMDATGAWIHIAGVPLILVRMAGHPFRIGTRVP